MPCWNKNFEKRRFDRDELIAFKNLISKEPMVFLPSTNNRAPFTETNKILKKCVNRNWTNVVLSHFGATQKTNNYLSPKEKKPL